MVQSQEENILEQPTHVKPPLPNKKPSDNHLFSSYEMHRRKSILKPASEKGDGSFKSNLSRPKKITFDKIDEKTRSKSVTQIWQEVEEEDDKQEAVDQQKTDPLVEER